MRMNKKGFTLVELMVVLAILGLLAGIGIPSYIRVLDRARIGADLGRVAQLQSNVNALISECGGVSQVKTGGDNDERLTDLGDEDEVALTALTGTSIITGKVDLSITDFLEGESALANLIEEMESLTNTVKGTAVWYVDKTGRVFLGDANGNDLLGGQ